MLYWNGLETKHDNILNSPQRQTVDCVFIYLFSILDFLPATILLPPKRLESLLGQAVELQTSNCIYHNTTMDAELKSFSLLSDHQCDR